MPSDDALSSPAPGGESSPPDSPSDARPTWTTEQLLGDQREVLIQHGDDLYRLRVTRHGKLILYK